MILLLLAAITVPAQDDQLITNIPGRKTISLNGAWQYIIDPYETGFYNYRYEERQQGDPEAYWNTDIPKNKSERKEHGYNNSRTLRVPGDWNSQDKKFLYYEGTVWYKRSFDYKPAATNKQVYLYFGAVNYRADVYLNGKKLGTHKGGFTPFNFKIPDSLLKPAGNFLVVKVDNKRYANEIPTLNTDWWNYGGITRDVMLVELPKAYIRDYAVHLAKGNGNDSIKGWVQLSDITPGEKITIGIPELKLEQSYTVDNNKTGIAIVANTLQYWSPQSPKRYRVIISSNQDRVEEWIGFRHIETKGQQVLLNGQPLFMRGISIHEEIPQGIRRAYSKADALQLLGWAKELGCNMVRLAHYPHSEMMTRMADSLGLLVWSEIPVYWTIDFSQAAVLDKAKAQLREMINRDRNRASIIIWSVGNETPVSASRTYFMQSLLEQARELDPTRLVSAALEVHYDNERHVNFIDDPLGQHVDIVAFNEYLGWYRGTPDSCRTANWETIYNKPLFISETGAEGLSGNHGDEKQMWTEEYQAWYYREQIAMLERMPSNFVGVSPWILVDFRSPRRNNPVFQDGWNNKGLFDHSGKKKKAFYLLRDYYKKKQGEK
ncbi:MAG TPA: glycoside hydrolase family 2 TIM barrel-domain containing protein [Chitinophagaceae bacterium]|nr:glycoside hydrolase family 2 TIM barrel-domain containing protein [Chitinophagaceae bacterium]